MNLVFLDFETYWSQTHTLSKMSPIEYCMHPDTEIISCSIKYNSHPTDVFFGEDEIRRVFAKLDWSNNYVIGHNMSGFDSMLLAWRLGVRPKMWGCTLAMARPIHAKTTGLGLAKLVEHYGIGTKRDAILHSTRGKHLADFLPYELQQMEVYNKNDTEQCAALFHILKKHYNAEELWHLDCNIRMLVEPQFELDTGLLQTALSVERSNKHKALLEVAAMLRPKWETVAVDVTDGPEYTDEFWDQDDDAKAEWVREQLASAPKFSALLEARGVEVPMKPSPTNPENQVPALAKTDEAFQELQEHEDEVVAAAARARLAVKSTLLETRIEAFLAAGRYCAGRLPVPIKYCGADTTGRDSGEQYNPQNLPRINPDKPKVSDALRNSLRAPKGYVVGVADQSGIELRVNHFLWREPSTTAAYAESPTADLYRDFAAYYYAKGADDVTKPERQFGKVCLAENSLILTRRSNTVGWTPIQDVTADMQLWDGEEWVWAQGSVFNGWKKTQPLYGLWLTPDHLVLCGTQWKAAGSLSDADKSLALATAAGTLSSPGTFGVRFVALPPSSCDVTADDQSTRLKATIFGTAYLDAVVSAPSRLPSKSGTGATSTPCQKTLTAPDFSTDSARLSLGAAPPETPRTRTTGGEVFECAPSGAQTELRSCGTSEGSMVGTSPSLKWTASTSTVGMSPATFDSSLEATTCLIDAEYETYSRASPSLNQNCRVYDIANCGPRSRYTALTEAGPVIVHNCHLGLGFGSGATTFTRIARLMGGIKLTDAEAENAVTGWRTRYANIVQGWRTCGEALNWIHKGIERDVDPWGMVSTCADGLRLPSGRLIRYPALQFVDEGQTWPDGRPKKSWVYGEGRHKAYLTGPKVDENIVQALARDSVFECALRFYKASRMRPIMRVHDELIYMFPESEAASLLAELQGIMRTPPSWWPELVVWSEGDIAPTYGAAK